MQELSRTNTQTTMILSNQIVLQKSDIFTDTYSYYKRGLKQEDKKPNLLSKDKQLIVIEQIIGRVYNLAEEKNFLLDLNDGKFAHIERNFKNFKEIIKTHINDVVDHQGFENIKLEKLFEHLKSRTSYVFKEYRSPLFDKTELIINEKQKALIAHIKIKYEHDLNGITPLIYDEISSEIEAHWQNKLESILDFMASSCFAVDKKSLWLLIMADSNFGKSKLFEWMKDWDGTAFIDFNDIIGKGISDKKPEDYYGKTALVIDEVMNFHRDLFKIEDNLEIRPMRNHTVYVPINARIMLSADGGQFNDEHLDKQITNRVAKIDLRSTESEELGDLEIMKYGKNTIKRVMSHYLFNKLTSKISFLKSRNIHEARDLAENQISDFIKTHKIVEKDFFTAVEFMMDEISLNFCKILGQKFYDDIKDDIVEGYVNNGISGYIIKKPKTTLNKILVHYDESLKYELGFKKINQICAKIKKWNMSKFYFDGVKLSGIFIPYLTIDEQKQREIDDKLSSQTLF